MNARTISRLAVVVAAVALAACSSPTAPRQCDIVTIGQRCVAQ